MDLLQPRSAKSRLAVRVPRDGEPFLFPAHHRERYLGGAGKRQRVRRRRGEIDDTAAHETLMSNLEGPALRDPLALRFTTGRRRLVWNKNCVAIGLSAGFLEPLESTGIHLIYRGIALLLSYFPDRHFRQADIDRFNRQTAFEFERVRDFLVVHYARTEREGEFWQHCRNRSGK